ncbi:ParB family protein [Arthrobacter alpinus]|uniref:ParB family protein n=1 Tax=Arthrobacter alpinus TaxID=656366 RepID=UPI0012FF58FD|nr:hypothetical protein [Arthrobacter alpinus]
MGAKRTPPSFSVTLPEGTADHVRAALQAAGAQEGYASVNDLLEGAIRKELRRLQRKHNAGKPWPGIPTGILPPGRRTQEETQGTGQLTPVPTVTTRTQRR